MVAALLWHQNVQLLYISSWKLLEEKLEAILHILVDYSEKIKGEWSWQRDSPRMSHHHVII